MASRVKKKTHLKRLICIISEHFRKKITSANDAGAHTLSKDLGMFDELKKFFGRRKPASLEQRAVNPYPKFPSVS
jgi:hypothetical protein